MDHETEWTQKAEDARLAWRRVPRWRILVRRRARLNYRQLWRIMRGVTWQSRVRAGDYSDTYLDKP